MDLRFKDYMCVYCKSWAYYHVQGHHWHQIEWGVANKTVVLCSQDLNRHISTILKQISELHSIFV